LSEVTSLGPVPSQRGRSLEELRALEQRLHEEVERAVRRLRLAGGSWSEIAGLLAMPKPTAHRRFKHVDKYLIELRAEGPVGTRQGWFQCSGTGLSWRTLEDLALPASEQRALAAWRSRPVVIEGALC
jgi:hypothetical protein